MKTICAWCQKHLSGDMQDRIVSHGICHECVLKCLEGFKRILETELPEEEEGNDEKENQNS